MTSTATFKDIRRAIDGEPRLYEAIAKAVTDPDYFLAAYLVAAGVLTPDEAHSLLVSGAFEPPGIEPGPGYAPLGGADWKENLRGIPRGPGFSEQGPPPFSPAMDRAATKITRALVAATAAGA
jgi:hypothetical protein